MKHLFRKLHIGGGGAASAPHRLPESPSPTAPLPPESTAGGSRCAAPGGGFNFLEEEYQVQLALALSASDRAGLEGPDSVQMKAAARMSLGAGDAPAVEHLSFRYWSYNIVDYHEKLVDGFYVVRDITSSHNLQSRMPSLLDLQRTPVSDNIDYEVVLVNRAVDQALRQLERRAISIALESRAAKVGTLASGLVQKIANLVVDSMGGPVGDTDDMLRRWTMRSCELRTCLKNIVLPLGSLDVGLSSHRALLFKVLADRINLPCRLVKGSYYTGTDEGAINFIKVDNSQYILDLMGAPGVLIPAESLSDFFQTSRPRLLSSSAIEQTTLGVCMPLDKAGYQFGKTSEVSERSSSTTDMRSGAVYLQPEEKSGVIPLAEVFSVDATQRFEHEFGELSSLGSQKAALFENKEVTSPAQQMKLDDVSKYVVDAAKNPEFAQKLHAILLKSRAPRPPVLLSELNPSLNSLEQKGIERSISMGKKVQEGWPPRNNLPLDSQSCFTAVDSSYLVGASGNVEVTAETTQMQDVTVICNGIHTDAGIPLHIEMSGLVSHVKGRNSISMDYSDYERTEWEIPWENLRIGERIGIGSYGEVYRADWNGTEVAVKKFLDQDLSGDALEQIRSEIKIMLRLRHPNVILFMGAITCPPNLSILTEFLPRGSLYKLLHRPNVQLDEKRRLKMAVDVAKGMNYLHTSHPTIVHRDLKSPNLLVDKNWTVKVCDFGLSQLKHHTFLSSKSAAGTPEWMAPEVLRNEPSNEKSDVYSFAVILWELATLQMPWSGMNPMQVVGAVGFQSRRLDIPEEVDPMVAEIISDCWQNDPNQRPSFAQLIPRLRQRKRLVVGDYSGPPG